MQLSDLRVQLAEAKAELRIAKDHYDTTRAVAEIAAINRLNGNAGKNEAERARNLTLELLHDEPYQDALAELRMQEAQIDQLQAQIAVAEDERDAERLAVRDRNSAAVERLARALEKMAPIPAAVAETVLPPTSDEVIREWYGR